MRRNYRMRLSAADFDAITGDNEEALVLEFYFKLIGKNEKLQNAGDEYPRGSGDIRFIRKLSRGQQLLMLIIGFDGQVKNGGITQFFWNCSEELFEVRDAIECLGPLSLLQNYEKALEARLGKKDRWIELRDICHRKGHNPDWESFRQTYGLLDLGWFDKAYFDKWGYNKRGQWVKIGH